MKIYWINLSYACFGIETENDKVVKAAPIAKWALGKNIQFVLDFYKKKKAEIKEIYD